MVDPQLEIEPYLEAAAQKSMRVTHIIETHVQADHVSGARRLSAVTGAPVFFMSRLTSASRMQPLLTATSTRWATSG